MNDSTSSRDSPSNLGDSLATCSISSLKLTAPPLYLHAENLPDHAAQQALQARVVQLGQRPNSGLLVRLQQLAAPLFDVRLCDELAHTLRIRGRQCRGRPDPPEELLVGASCA